MRGFYLEVSHQAPAAGGRHAEWCSNKTCVSREVVGETAAVSEISWSGFVGVQKSWSVERWEAERLKVRGTKKQ